MKEELKNRIRMGKSSLSALSALLLSMSAGNATLLVDYSLAGDYETTKWHEAGAGSTAYGQLGSGNAGLLPDSSSTGDAEISVLNGGFSAGTGFYSFMSNYSISLSDTVSFSESIANVVLQVAWMPNDSTEDGGVPYGGSLGALGNFAEPVLTFTHDGGSENLVVSAFATGTSVEGSGGGFDGTFVGTGWQWDLSGYTGVSAVNLELPVTIHTSTVAAQLDLGSSFTAVPEPGHYALIGGVFSLLVLIVRRRFV